MSKKSKQCRQNIGNPRKDFHIVSWITKEYDNHTEACDVCGGNVYYKIEGFNEKRGEAYCLYSCDCLECVVECHMRIYTLIK